MEGSTLEHVLGTDRLGRDTLSRLVYGAQISLTVSLVGILLTGVVGAAVGLLAGFWGAWVDTICMRLVDISLSLPGILMAVLLSVVFKPSFKNVVIVVIFLLWPSICASSKTCSARPMSPSSSSPMTWGLSPKCATE